MSDWWRGINWFAVNGHNMYLMSEEEMGGGCSGISIGCNCSGKFAGYSFWDWPDTRVYEIDEAIVEAFKDMWTHSRTVKDE